MPIVNIICTEKQGIMVEKQEKFPNHFKKFSLQTDCAYKLHVQVLSDQQSKWHFIDERRRGRMARLQKLRRLIQINAETAASIQF